ncbi:DUF302 domain-containing protein [Thiosulfatihalobacter marinus]|uniref:DUF302 domain-containing protein n=1 Tax=Thiosulfatihalobacter marinus TaxID=2792481 RepID=UPI0018D7D6A2|nr:DUF302 domain-containing protein [Thiosulfatihalobacter marinus]
MKEMMGRMDADMKAKGQSMMEQCKSMMARMEPDMRAECQSMMQRAKSMMGESEKAGPGDLVFTHTAAGTFDEIEARVEADGEAIGLELKKHYPFSKNLPAQKGLEIKEDASVFELCNAPLAAELLNTQPELNVLMPCRISIYAKDGEVFVTIPNLETQLAALGAEGELKANILDLYAKMVEMIKAW